MKEVMVRAWEIAREGVKKFGGKVQEFFRAALIMAWEEVKMEERKRKLKGSEKQIKWAIDIIKNVEEIIAEASKIDYDSLFPNSRMIKNEYLARRIEDFRNCNNAGKLIDKFAYVTLEGIKNKLNNQPEHIYFGTKPPYKEYALTLYGRLHVRY